MGKIIIWANAPLLVLPWTFPLIMSLLQVEELMEQFLQSYDIVLVRDETLDVANGILNCITAKN